MRLALDPRMKMVVQVGVSVAIVAVLVSQLDWGKTKAMIRNIDLGLFGLLVLVLVGDRILMGFKWYQLLTVLSSRLGIWSAIRIYYESSFQGHVLPLGGMGPDVVRFFKIRARGVEPYVSISSILMERLIGVMATFSLVAIGSGLLGSMESGEILGMVAWLIAAGAIAANAVLVLLLFHRPAREVILRALRFHKLSERIDISRFLDAGRLYSAQPRRLLRNFALSLLEQLFPVCALWISGQALGVPLPFLVCLAVIPVTSVVQRIPIAYSGIGIAEGTAVALLVSLGIIYSDAVVLVMATAVAAMVSLIPGAILAVHRNWRAAIPEEVSASAGVGNDRRLRKGQSN